jgi:site-specific DNA-methyltransferase (adenine-specific)
MNQLIHGDCAQVLPLLRANAFDSLVTDPPASIKFMGQAWDSDRGGRRQWVSWLSQVMREAFRVLKPGAHGLIWAIPRRSHWTALALEDAGFEIRDCICHYFLRSLPKSLNVGLAIDAKLQFGKSNSRSLKLANDSREGEGRLIPGGRNNGILGDVTGPRLLKDKPTTDQAKEWGGWGTHLKPAIEYWWLVRKPLGEKTVPENVLKWGTGAMNIDASRIPLHEDKSGGFNRADGSTNYTKTCIFEDSNAAKHERPSDPHSDSRYPSHFIVSDWALLGKHTGFFHPPIYCPKPTKKEKNKGCEDLPQKNNHKTVKPVALMKYFITLLTRPGGSVLDCFAGSFTTGVAAQELGFGFTGIEENAESVQIGVRRLSA